MPRTGRIIKGYARMWPREVFDVRKNGDHLDEVKDLLKSPGVYVLYKDEEPHYIGKTNRKLWMRILEHTRSNDKLFNFWNFFSAFEVPGEERDRDEIEAILIASMPTANSSNPKFQPIPLPKQVSAHWQRDDELTSSTRGSKRLSRGWMPSCGGFVMSAPAAGSAGTR